MAHLVLVKHSLPAIDPARPAHSWHLAPEGRRRCAALAAHLAAYLPARLACSPEPKAAETAALAGASLGLVPHVVGGLEEHHRATAAFLGQEAFQRTMAAFFAAPDRLIFGEETADAAYHRFDTAVGQLIAAAPHETHIVVAHGTVISLFASRHCGLAPFPLWQRLGLPSFVVLELPALRLVTVVDTVASDGAVS
ncbi:MAG TPA: histidine phosphatase family protein [Roseiflexaceae bacterium]|nr:histidine phosphatase family protein [Roseiflexaceae bacterium]